MNVIHLVSIKHLRSAFLEEKKYWPIAVTERINDCINSVIYV